MKVAIVQFPGSNCERETILSIKRCGMIPVEFLWNQSPQLLDEMDAYVIVGGFSYEDRSRAGIIAALDPVMDEIKRQNQKGKPVLGICNGAQILVETGMVPGTNNSQLAMALTENKRIEDGKILGTGFFNTWITMRTHAQVTDNAFTRHINEHTLLNVPIAHAQGRFVMESELLNELDNKGLIAFQYCDAKGQIIDNFPVNPNGSMANIAAVLNGSGTVMAMMPHPERTTTGDIIFTSMKEYIQDQQKNTPQDLTYVPRIRPQIHYKPSDPSSELLVRLIITDNEAITVQNTLQKLGISVSVQRLTHWSIGCNSNDQLEAIIQSGVLYNDRKEYVVNKDELPDINSICYLVRPKDDLIGQQKKQILEDHFHLQGIDRVEKGCLWIFEGEEGSIKDLSKLILQTNIIYNPFAYECYEYTK